MAHKFKAKNSCNIRTNNFLSKTLNNNYFIIINNINGQ